MAESLLSGIAEGVLGKIASPVLKKAIEIYNLENQIDELKEALTAIQAVLLGAEYQQAKKPGLRVWLDRLQHVLYDVEDVLDEIECEALRKQVISRYVGVKRKLRRFFSLSNPVVLRVKISCKIKEIQERISKISIEKDRFDLNKSTDSSVAHVRSGEMPYSFINKSNVVGRDEDKEKIITMLMQPGDKKLSVIPVVGMGGLGKTTLTKLVFHDDGVKEQFEPRLWVSMPEKFDLKKIIEGITNDATGQSLSDLDIQRLHTRLRDKKYLLVLDGVWSMDYRRWEELRDLLSVGADGSKIIVTTRDSGIASLMGTHPAHNLKGLSYEDSVALFRRWAFVQGENEPDPTLIEIGNDIVKKSRGVPLLVTVLGSLLRKKHEEGYWENIRDSETWDFEGVENNILPVLKISYDNLPSHLKRCFYILSLFPKGEEMDAPTLVWHWMALGFISSTGEKSAPEDAGDDYFRDLRSRCLIQEVEQQESISSFEVHDLVHSLASSVAQNYCSTIDLNTQEILEKVRHVSISTASLEEISDYDGVPPFLRKKTSKRLRAIMFQYKVNGGVITRKFVETCISNCKHLRSLDLSYGSFEELPSSICNLKQLRSLLLLENKRLKKLPYTICELQCLLQLNVNGCSELGELPKNMNRLVNLRFLSITTKQKSLQKSKIQHLENLQILGLHGCQTLQILFEGACRWTCLRELEIMNCGGPLLVPFGELISLKRLIIDDSSFMLIPDINSSFPSSLRIFSISNCIQVLELLQCLKESACTLETFAIFDCPTFTAIPEWLLNHIRLREIHLIRCLNLSSMPQGIRSLTALRELRIEHCGELSRRCEPRTGDDWHKIAHVPRIKLDMIKIQWTDV